MLDLHRYLMSDERRTLAFREAIHRVVKPGDVVVDLGSGSGILSLFAAQAGARKVFSIEKQHVADSAHLLVRQLGLSDRIQVFHQMSHEVELPELADVLITETIGVVGFDEGILGNVADARKRMLRPGATIIPRQLAMHVAPVTLPELHDRHIAWWRTPRYGFDLSPMAVFASNRLITTPELAPECFLGEPARILNADLTVAEDESIHGQTSLVIAGAGILHGFGAWFTTELVDGITFSNEKPGTSWELGFFPLDTPVVVTPETTIVLEIDSMSGRTWRWRGSIGEQEFDQTTLLESAPCIR